MQAKAAQRCKEVSDASASLPNKQNPAASPPIATHENSFAPHVGGKDVSTSAQGGEEKPPKAHTKHGKASYRPERKHYGASDGSAGAENKQQNEGSYYRPVPSTAVQVAGFGFSPGKRGLPGGGGGAGPGESGAPSAGSPTRLRDRRKEHSSRKHVWVGRFAVRDYYV